jgi:hypothetical protein
VPRYKPGLSGQSQLVPVDFAKQVLAGTFEHALVHLISNEDTGATAYDPRVLLKIVLLGYSRGLIAAKQRRSAICTATATLFLAAIAMIAWSLGCRPGARHMARSRHWTL